jgi:hypothetical protein
MLPFVAMLLLPLDNSSSLKCVANGLQPTWLRAAQEMMVVAYHDTWMVPYVSPIPASGPRTKVFHVPRIGDANQITAWK